MSMVGAHSSSPHSIKSTNGRSKMGSSTPSPTAVPGTARAAFRGLSRMAPGAAARLAESLFLKPLRLSPAPRERWWATDAEELRFPLPDGRALVGWVWGWSGPTILLVHGWGGRGLQMGAFAAPLVEAGYRVVAFDALAHGRSPGARTSLPEFAGAIRDVMDHLGGVEAVIAHSFGAATTTVALAGALDPAVSPAPRSLVYVAPASDFGSVAARFSDMTGFTPEVVGRMRGQIERRFDIRWRDLQSRALAPRLRQRLLILHDEWDEEVPLRDSRLLAEAWPGARLEVTHGLGHHRILRQTQSVASAVEFLRGSYYGV